MSASVQVRAESRPGELDGTLIIAAIGLRFFPDLVRTLRGVAEHARAKSGNEGTLRLERIDFYILLNVDHSPDLARLIERLFRVSNLDWRCRRPPHLGLNWSNHWEAGIILSARPPVAAVDLPAATSRPGLRKYPMRRGEAGSRFSDRHVGMTMAGTENRTTVVDGKNRTRKAGCAARCAVGLPARRAPAGRHEEMLPSERST